MKRGLQVSECESVYQGLILTNAAIPFNVVIKDKNKELKGNATLI